nr:uncharacterized protein LOC105479113 [Macaca nemestrina]
MWDKDEIISAQPIRHPDSDAEGQGGDLGGPVWSPANRGGDAAVPSVWDEPSSPDPGLERRVAAPGPGGTGRKEDPAAGSAWACLGLFRAGLLLGDRADRGHLEILRESCSQAPGQERPGNLHYLLAPSQRAPRVLTQEEEEGPPPDLLVPGTAAFMGRCLHPGGCLDSENGILFGSLGQGLLSSGSQALIPTFRLNARLGAAVSCVVDAVSTDDHGLEVKRSPLRGGWASCNRLKGLKSGTEVSLKKKKSCLGTAVSAPPGSFRPAGLPSGFQTCLASPHNHVSRFLEINLIYISFWF